jgi:hypothetical protein
MLGHTPGQTTVRKSDDQLPTTGPHQIVSALVARPVALRAISFSSGLGVAADCAASIRF